MDELIVKQLRRSATDIETRLVERWRQESADNERTYQEIRALWALTGASVTVLPPPPSQSTILTEAEERRRHARSRRQGLALLRSPWLGYGLVAAAVAAVALLVPGRGPGGPGPESLTTLGSSSMAGQVVTMSLSDGSYIRLGPGADVEFPPSTERREVILDGAAFFAVASGETPFVVRTAGARVTVHGTRFEVRTEGAETRVVVVEGTVRVEGDHGGADIVAGQVAYLSAGSAPQVVDRGDVWNLLQWEAGLLVFQSTPLAEVARELGRHFGRSVRVDPAIQGRRVTACFEDEPAEEVVAAVCLVIGARCEVGDSLVTMSGR